MLAASEPGAAGRHGKDLRPHAAAAWRISVAPRQRIAPGLMAESRRVESCDLAGSSASLRRTGSSFNSDASVSFALGAVVAFSHIRRASHHWRRGVRYRTTARGKPMLDKSALVEFSK